MSDKTTAALAAEQADVEATTTQEPELLPAATLDELEQVDLGTVAEGERAPFRITDDRCADWAIRKIADERSEYDRLKALADEQIAAINEKVAAARKRMENGTSYLTSCLADFFATVPHKETKTTEKYRLLSGTLTFKKGTTKTKLDETKLVPWLKANGYSTTATPKAYAGSVPVFCAHDAIVPLKDLRPNPKNPNQHPPEQIKLLASIIRATGWRAPITVSKRSGLVTKGHGRLMAAQLDDLTDAPVDYQDYASEAEELADLTADNRIAELATTDNKMLAEVFADIDTGEIPFMLSGYTEDDYGNIVTALSEALHTKEPSSDPDAEIPAPAAPVTQYGDLWILGRHRVLCGDCTRPEDRALLLDGNKPEILLTDPPYCSGGSKESQKSTGSIGTERKNGKAPKIANDILSTRGYQNLIRGALTDIPCLYAYIFTDWCMWVYLFDLVEAAGFGVKSEIVWDKGTPGMGVGWRSQHELILFGAKAATHFDGHKGYGNVLSISRSGNELHPTQKPVELLEKLVDNTDFATGVYDPFGGSGTTLAACEAYGQPSYIMELTPAFTDVIVKRYIRITGKTTVRCVRQGRELPREEIAAIFEPDEEGGEQE